MSAPSTVQPTPANLHSSTEQPAGPSTPRRLLFLAIAIIVALGAFAAITRIGLGNDAALNSAGEPLELSLGAGDGLASCLAFDTAVLATMSPAFAATATAVEGETIILEVDRWYAGGDASTVQLNAPAGLEALIGGIDFQVGQHYLITAAEGTVNYCGYSGPATPEFTAAFDQAFGA